MMAYTPIAPNEYQTVVAVDREHPGLIAHPHRFTAKVACRLYEKDKKWGHNGKRGNPADLSEDCVCYVNPSGPGGVEIYDVIIGANTPGARPAWQDVTPATIAAGAVGVWTPPVCEDTPPEPPKPPPPPPLKPREVFAQEFAGVNLYYASMAGLQRPGGMVLHGRADVLAMTQWGWDLMAGATLAQVLDAIRASDEWKQKHPEGR